MPIITILPEDVINKIAAGEVIERPASVVKELVENSLDAGATKISIEIKDSGKELIIITDDGGGMDKEDAHNSLLRHATSKLHTADDLFAITTLGFRGEALASIAAVSKLSLLTKKQEGIEGFYLTAEGGTIISSGIKAAQKGTRIEVKNLFFNTPARKKFLKSDSVELRHIIDVVIHYALINNSVAFTIIHDGHELLRSPALQDRRENIASLYGSALAKELLEIAYNHDGITILGYVAKPYHARNDKTQQALFVNGRWIKNNDLVKAVYDAFHSVLFVHKHPVFVLHLQLDPQRIDVNVHPHKLEIKIEQQDKVTAAVFTAVRETLQKHNLVPVLNFESDHQLLFQSSTTRPASKYSFEPSTQTTLDVREASNTVTGSYTPVVVTTSPNTSEHNLPALHSLAVNSRTQKLPPLKILGQIHKTFFVAETTSGVIFIDQHAAHERVLYEQFMEQLMNKDVKIQRLLEEEMLEFSPAETVLLLQQKLFLSRFGFTVDHFGGNTFILKTVPSLFGKVQPGKLVHALLENIETVTASEIDNEVTKIQEKIITIMACRAAVMAGEELSIPRIESILRDLEMTELSFTCPHGRPTMIKTTVEELEKKFRRK